jgi:hypothetical protein
LTSKTTVIATILEPSQASTQDGGRCSEIEMDMLLMREER